MPATKKMASALSSFVRRGTALLAQNKSSDEDGFTKASEANLFPKVDPEVDGQDCDHDCASCTIKYPAKFSIDEDDKLYGHVKGWATHLLVATGKTDWVRDVEDEKGSVMEAVGRAHKPLNGVSKSTMLCEVSQLIMRQKLMLSASDIPLPSSHLPPYEQPTSVLLLPAFTIIENITPKDVPDLITHVINSAPTNTSPLDHKVVRSNNRQQEPQEPQEPQEKVAAHPEETIGNGVEDSISIPAVLPFASRPCPHDALILLCSQKTRDARCGQSAPLLRREFQRHLRPLGLYRDATDERPGGVGIYFISHVGGHKYSANVMIYRRAGMGKKEVMEGANTIMTEGEEQTNGTTGEQGAGQCIWLARVRPEDCEGIIKFTVLQGKVVKPERQLRGGFDRGRGLTSW